MRSFLVFRRVSVSWAQGSGKGKWPLLSRWATVPGRAPSPGPRAVYAPRRSRP